MRLDALRLQSALLALAARAVSDHRLLAEQQRARREFFGAAEVGIAREQRFLEWFLLERESLALAAVPAQVLDLAGDEEALVGSSAGVWIIESVESGTAEARDLQDDEVLDLQAPADALQPGDLMVGRVYVGDRAGWQPSAAVAIYRPGRALAAALKRDLARLSLDRRLSQMELEHLLLRRQAPVAPATATRPVEHLEAELDAVLQAGGAQGLAPDISQDLAAAERPGNVVGPLLDQLAFDTDVDLDRARQLLMELWGAHHAGIASSTDRDLEEEAEAEAAPALLQSTDELATDELATDELTTESDRSTEGEEQAHGEGETLGARLLRTLDAGLKEHKDVEELFSELEAMAGIGPDDDGSGDDEIQEDAGDLSPLVTEFLWEKRRSGTGVETVLRLWLGLQQNAALPHLDLEQVTSQDLMRVLLHVYLQAEPLQRAAAVRAAFAALREFSVWAEDTQDMSLTAQLAECEAKLLAPIDRLQTASLRLSGHGTDAARQVLLRVEDIGKDGFGVRSDEGNHWLAADREVAALLREGDLLLASLAPGKRSALRGLVVVLPGCAEPLIG